MGDVLVRIKQAVLAGRFILSEKAREEMLLDGLTELDVVESIANAPAIYKRLRSTSSRRAASKEYLYVIQSPNLHGVVIYTKGKFIKKDGSETFYVLISSKLAS